jgi:hypothetical protein
MRSNAHKTAYPVHFAVDLSTEQKDKLDGLSLMIGMPRAVLLRRMIEVLLIPQRQHGQRLCVCEGERKVFDIAF